ncbi:MAG: restriction endonuclease [Anaerolineaceae bacterium]|jgi:restriction system protein
MIPTFQELMLPLLKLAADGKTHAIRDAVAVLSDQFNLSDEERQEMISSGVQTVIANRISWARTYMKKAGLLMDPQKGYFKITEAGSSLLAENPAYIDNKLLSRYPSFQEFQNRQKPSKATESTKGENNATPEELLEEAYQEIHANLADNLLETIMKSSPYFFERLVIDLLLKMGYGGSHRELSRAVGRSGDEGIDGIIDQDRLGLDRIYIQAKRWDPSSVVSRPEVQKFAGALLGRFAKKGVFITTARFSDHAKTYVSNLDTKVVLIDGKQLADFMIEYGVGVTTQSVYEIKTIDNDFFSEPEE